MYTHLDYMYILANSKHYRHYFCRIEKQEEEEEMCDVEEQIVGECVEVGEEVAEKGPFSNDCDDEDEVDLEGASDSSDVVMLANCVKSGKSTLLAIN